VYLAQLDEQQRARREQAATGGIVCPVRLDQVPDNIRQYVSSLQEQIELEKQDCKRWRIRAEHNLELEETLMDKESELLDFQKQLATLQRQMQMAQTLTQNHQLSRALSEVVKTGESNCFFQDALQPQSDLPTSLQVTFPRAGVPAALLALVQESEPLAEPGADGEHLRDRLAMQAAELNRLLGHDQGPQEIKTLCPWPAL